MSAGMGSILGGMARQNVVFLAGNLANSLINFVLVPFYVNYFTPAEYGALVLFEIALFVLFLLINAGMDTALMREFYFLKEERARASLVTSLFTFLVVNAAVWVAVIWLIRHEVASNLSNRTDAPRLLLFAAGIAASDVLVGFLLSILRIRERAAQFVALNTGKLALTLGLAIWLVAHRGAGVEGALAARLAASVAVISAGLILQRRYLAGGLDRPQLARSLKYGLPLLPAGLAAYLLISADRYVLRHLTDEATVGIYSFAYKLAALNDVLLSAPFALTWAPMRFKIATQENAPAIYTRVITYYVIGGMFTTSMLIALSREAFALLAPPVYAQGLTVLPIIAVSYFLYGLTNPLNTGVYLKDRTALVPVVIGAAAILNIALNLVLAPRYLMFGSAISVCASFVFLAAAVAWLSHRLYPVPIEWGRVGKALIVGVVTAAAGLSFDLHGLAVSISLKIAVLPMLFVTLIFATGLLNDSERRWLKGRLSGRPAA